MLCAFLIRGLQIEIGGLETDINVLLFEPGSVRLEASYDLKTSPGGHIFTRLGHSKRQSPYRVPRAKTKIGLIKVRDNDLE